MKPTDHREKAKRAALNALRRARHAAAKAGVELSEWEGEFLGSVEGRVEKYGRAFADPDLGAINGALSLRQGLKLRQIAAKAKGEDKPGKAARAKVRAKPAAKAKRVRKTGFGKTGSGLKRSGFAKPRRKPDGR